MMIIIIMMINELGILLAKFPNGALRQGAPDEALVQQRQAEELHAAHPSGPDHLETKSLFWFLLNRKRGTGGTKWKRGKWKKKNCTQRIHVARTTSGARTLAQILPQYSNYNIIYHLGQRPC